MLIPFPSTLWGHIGKPAPLCKSELDSWWVLPRVDLEALSVVEDMCQGFALLPADEAVNPLSL